MILDLTTSLTEKFTYKNPSLIETWGSFCYSIILPDYSQESSWRNLFLRGKIIDKELDIPDREALP